MMKTLKSFLVLLTLFFLLSSCTKNKLVSIVDKEDLFDINYGNFEDELRMFSLSGSGEVNTFLSMRDGFFYIMNGEAKKVMEMTSYGDLTSLYYNESVNPLPSFITENSSSTQGSEDMITSTRTAVSYAFNEPSCIATDSQKYLYVVDILPLSRQETDIKTNQIFSHIVVRFDDKKEYAGYIGQQGPGGTPFPFIKSIFTTNKNELVVLCSTENGNLVFWFSSDGYLLYTIPIEKDSIPNPFSDGKDETFFSVGNIVPDYNERKLFIKVDYFKSYVDESSRVQSGIEYISTLVYPFSVERKTFDSPVTIPPFEEQLSQGFSKETFDIPYDFIGITESGWFYFMLATDEGFSVQMVQCDGQKILKRRLSLNKSECIFYTFNLSREGIISSLIAKNEKGFVCWWRLDSLIQAVIKN